MALRPVMNTEGVDISTTIVAAAARHALDPVALLALLKAESGLDPKAERWGRETTEAVTAITQQDWPALAGIIGRAWPDISFGYSQRIVLFHDQGDRSPSINNCLRVRAYVFAHPDDDIEQAARRLASGIARSLDGTALGGMVVYNAGSDRRNDPVWMRDWGSNVRSYERALEWAEAYRLDIKALRARDWQTCIDVTRGFSRELREGPDTLPVAALLARLAEASKQLADVAQILEQLRATEPS